MINGLTQPKVNLFASCLSWNFFSSSYKYLLRRIGGGAYVLILPTYVGIYLFEETNGLILEFLTLLNVEWN